MERLPLLLRGRRSRSRGVMGHIGRSSRISRRLHHVHIHIHIHVHVHIHTCGCRRTDGSDGASSTLRGDIPTSTTATTSSTSNTASSSASAIHEGAVKVSGTRR